MDGHCKNVYLIGVLYILCCLCWFLGPLTRFIRVLIFDDNGPFLRMFNRSANEGSSRELMYLLSVGGLLAFLAILAGLMIRGVVQKRYQLMAPFVITNFLLCSGLIFLNLSTIGSDYKSYRLFYHLGNISVAIAYQIILLYPTCTLLLKLRSQAAQERLLQNSSVNYENKANVVIIKNKTTSEIET